MPSVGFRLPINRSQFRFVASQQFRYLYQPAVDVLHHRIVKVRSLNPFQRPGCLPLFRFGGVVGVRRAYRFAQFVKAHARSSSGIIVTVHVPGYFLVLVVGFVILVTGRFFRSGCCFRNVFFLLSVSLRCKNSIIFSRLREVSRFVLRCPD